MAKIRLFIKENKPFHVFLLILSLIFPVATIFELFFFSLQIINPIDIMWVGFYSCLLIAYAHKNIIIKALIILLNLLCFFLLCIGFSMGGGYGLLWLVFKMIIPFIAEAHILSFS